MPIKFDRMGFVNFYRYLALKIEYRRAYVEEFSDC